MHHGHVSDGTVAWRMPPMNMTMPMMPGLEGELPPVAPFLPAEGIDLAMLPLAKPSEVVELADGDTISVAVSVVRREIAGRPVVMYGYNGQHPGPLIKAPRGSTVFIDVVNRIELPTTVHWHGVRLDNAFDGVPGITQDPIETGDSFLYEVHVRDSGIYWYHPHMREDIQQDLGLYGNLLVAAPEPDYYGPAHREEVLVLDDVLMDDNGFLPWGESDPTHALMGRFGNIMLVNGEVEPVLDAAAGEVVRFYITNVANTRTFNVRFGTGRVKVVASDVSRYEREEWISSLPIAPAERYVVDVKFETSGTTYLTNNIQAIDHFRGVFYPHADTLVTVVVSERPAATGPTEAFATLREHDDVTADIDQYRQHFDRPPDHTLTLDVDVEGLPLSIMLAMEIDTLYVPPLEWNDAMPMMNWLSTGSQVRWVLRDRETARENMDIDWRFEQGEVVKIRIFNDPLTFHPMHHPIHVHGQRYLVLSVDGVPAENLVWKDTAVVPVGSTMDILVDMSNPGEWMMHCHIAEHLHSGMMLSFTVDGVDD